MNLTTAKGKCLRKRNNDDKKYHYAPNLGVYSDKKYTYKQVELNRPLSEAVI